MKTEKQPKSLWDMLGSGAKYATVEEAKKGRCEKKTGNIPINADAYVFTCKQNAGVSHHKV